ncbi:MAG: NYN domain-containing protein [Aestuariivirga sp.]
MPANPPRIALFIDAENASVKDTKKIFELCGGLGQVAIARCFGRLAALKSWEKAMIEHHIVPVMTPPWASKANASDFALTIDAVSLLQGNAFDKAVIASSDADFAQLAMFARERGMEAHGIGEAKATPATRKAYDVFHVLNEVAPKKVAPKVAPAKATPVPKPHSAVPKSGLVPVPTELVLNIFQTLADGKPGVEMQAFGRVLAKEYPTYKKGYRSLNNFLRKSGLFEFDGNEVRLK